MTTPLSCRLPLSVLPASHLGFGLSAKWPSPQTGTPASQEYLDARNVGQSIKECSQAPDCAPSWTSLIYSFILRRDAGLIS